MSVGLVLEGGGTPVGDGTDLNCYSDSNLTLNNEGETRIR